MKGYKIGTDLYIFPQEAGEIPYVAEDVTKIYIQYEQLEAFKEDNADYADIMVGYNYYTMSVNKKDWACHADDDIVVSKTDPDLAWSSDSATVAIGADDNVFPTLTNTDNVEVTYASSATGVATINDEGTVTLVDNGETTISAAFEGDDEYNAKTVTYDLTVRPQGISHTLGTWGSDLSGYNRFLDSDHFGEPGLANSNEDLAANYLSNIVVTVNDTEYTFDVQNVDQDGYYWDDPESKTVALKWNQDTAFPDVHIKNDISEPTVIETYYGDDYIIYSITWNDPDHYTTPVIYGNDKSAAKVETNLQFDAKENVDLYNDYNCSVVDANSNPVILTGPTSELNALAFTMPASDITITITAKNQ